MRLTESDESNHSVTVERAAVEVQRDTDGLRLVSSLRQEFFITVTENVPKMYKQLAKRSMDVSGFDRIK